MHNRDVNAPILAVGLISAAAIAYEVLLIRLFALVHWHHLVATAIALALLGYGVSGTLLALTRDFMLRHLSAAFVGNALVFAVAMPVSIALAQRVPFDPLAIAWDPGQWWALALIFLLLAVPFFAAANCIGLALSAFPQSIPRLYGVDLLGAGFGALALLGALSTLHPTTALAVVYLLSCAALVAAAVRLCWHPRAVTAAVLLLLVPAALWLQPAIQPAPYKDLAQASQVLGAETELALHGIDGTVTVVRNRAVPTRFAPGLSLLAADLPPEQRALFVDGDLVGVISDFSAAPSAGGYLRELTSALPYRLRTAPRVLVLNAGSGELVQQALLHGATRVTAVESNRLLYEARCGHYAALAAQLCDADRVHWRLQSSRAFLNRHRDPVDLLVVTAAADDNGLDALALDFTLTVEAFGQYLSHLAPSGLIAVDLPTRVPPRLTARLTATARVALAGRGAVHPADHVVVIRGWRRASMLIAREPLSAADLERVRAFGRAKGFDLVWLPDIEADEVNRVQRLSRPQFHTAARQLLTYPPGEAAAGMRLRVGPARDDRPFAHRFTRWSELRDAIASGDAARLAQVDTGLTLAAGTVAIVGLLSLVLILGPLHALQRSPSASGSRWRTLAYFALVGLAFLFIEIAWIHRIELLLDHPVVAASVVLAVFLVFAGLGSLWSQRRAAARPRGALWGAVLGIALVNLAYLGLLPGLQPWLADLPLVARILGIAALLAPLAFLMGLPFPVGLRALGTQAPALVPWAWGINGCASVISAASASLLATEIGFDGLLLTAAAAYLLVPLVLPPGAATPGTSGRVSGPV